MFGNLDAGRFADILDLGQPVLTSDDLDVEVEWDCCVISQYPIESAQVSGDQIEFQFQLAANHTDCLAKEKCGCESESEAPIAAGCCR
ncbi:MAG: DUF6428 family protein [Spartobacteria bacterium]